MKYRMLFLLSLAILFFCCLATAHAASFTAVSYDSVRSGMKVSLDGNIHKTSTVEFSVDMTQDGTELSELRGWCIDPWQPAAIGDKLDVTVELVSPDMIPGGMEAAWLVANADNYLSNLGDSLKTAALQLAIWEVVAEKNGAFDLKTGDFQVLYGNGATDPAADYLEALKTDFSSADPNLLTTQFAAARSGIYQDFILAGVNANPPTTAATPEPSTLFLMGAGMIALGLTLRRRKAEIV